MRAVSLAALALASGTAQAHGTGSAIASAGGEAAIVTALITAGFGYALGARRLAIRRGHRPPASPHDGLWFAGGLTVLALTLLGPLDRWSEDSFAVHMIQHELLMLAAAPMLVRGRPLARWTWALPRAARTRLQGTTSSVKPVWSAVTGATGACALQTAALWAWHLPGWFRSAVEHPGVHILQHLTFIVAALCFWWSVLRPGALRQAATRGIAALFFTTLVTGALGALLTFGSTPWYAIPGQSPPFGMSLLEDQQLGGLIMWVPGGLVYVVIALWLAAHALREGSRPASARVKEALGPG
jgi:putative membrane protein